METILNIYLCGMGFTFIFELSIGIFTIIKFRKSTAIGNELKSLFILSFILAILTTTAVMVIILLLLLVPIPSFVFVFIICDGLFWFGYLSFFVILLATLVTRLHVTFRGSTLEMTKNNMYLFGIIFLLLFILCIGIAVRVALEYYRSVSSLYDMQSTTRIYLGIPFLCIFLIGSALSIRLFVINIFELTKLQCGSLRDLTVNADDISLNLRQQRTLHLSAKYVSLFTVASLSTIVCAAISFQIIEYTGLVLSIDLCANLLCLHLQFAFADEQYRKYCYLWDSCFTVMVHNEAKRTIHKESQYNTMYIADAVNDSDTDDASTDEDDDDDPNTDPLIGEAESV